MPSQDDILRKLLEDIRPLQQTIDANLRELEDQQGRIRSKRNKGRFGKNGSPSLPESW